MFGHQDKKDDEQSSQEETVIAPDTTAETTTDTSTADAVTPPEETAATTDTPTDTPATDSGATGDDPTPAPVSEDAAPDDKPADDAADSGWQHPGAPLEDDKAEEADAPHGDENEEDPSKGPAPIEDIVGTSAGPDFKPFPQPSSEFHGGNQSIDNTPHELIDVKQKALEDLGPLVDKLDQSPEDKFRTIMMMIQASDDQSLIDSAYKAAHEIKDEKVRAQALLDVVNEINYFTQHPEQ